MNRALHQLINSDNEKNWDRHLFSIWRGILRSISREMARVSIGKQSHVTGT
jgi:hypothetical protein